MKVSYSVSFARVKAGARLREAESVTPMVSFFLGGSCSRLHIFGGGFPPPVEQIVTRKSKSEIAMVDYLVYWDLARVETLLYTRPGRRMHTTRL